MVQMASVTRTRGILRRCAPQDDNLFVILSGTTWSEEFRACAFVRQGEYTRMARRVVAPYETAASLPKVRAKRAGRARTARPYGVAPIPLHAWVAGGWQPPNSAPL